MEAYQVIAQGRVQGVGFRFYVMQIAEKIGVKGTVRNLTNGNVQIIAQCNQSSLEKLIKAIQVPQHRMMKVDKLTINEIEIPKKYTKFSIVY